jgi:ribonuclease G
VEPVSAASENRPADDSAESRRDRRGRRSRRRRGPEGGFPDAKYASPADTLESGEPGETESGQPAPAPAPAAGADPREVILLPGESLAKYRKQPSPPVEDQDPDQQTEDTASGDDAFEEAAEEAAEEAVEQLLDRVDELEQEELLARNETGPVIIDSDSGDESDDDSGDDDSGDDSDEGPEDDSGDDLDDDAGEDLDDDSGDDLDDEQGEDSGDGPEDEEGDESGSPDDEAVEDLSGDDEADGDPAAAEASGDGSAIEASESPAPAEDQAGESAGEEDGIAQASEQEEGVEPARMPQSLTATLRAKGERFGHRVSRRRRRGRGADAPAETASSDDPIEAAPAVVTPDEVEVRQTDAQRPPRRDRGDRPERSDRGDRSDRGERGERSERSDYSDRERRERPPLPSISDLLKEGQEIIVQIAKEPLGQKGARITSHIALPGRYVVYMPTVEHFGVSRKISTEEERLRLKKILQKYQEGVPGGYIMRTAGEGRSEEDIASDMQYLANLWHEIKTKADKRRAPALLHHDVQIVERLLRDQLTDGFKAVWVDSEDLYEQVLHSMERLAPSLLSRVKLYTRSEPIFEAFGITQELEKAIRPKVWLKSGGYIVINQTEALVAIDINTGKYVGKSNRLEDTIVKTNLEAVKEIVRQMRLRDLGGIIVVDFIDMDERKNRQKVMQALEDAMKSDKAPYKILQFNDFGLVAITRKRVKQSLERTLCSPCPYCEGAGYIKSLEAIVSEIVVEAQKYAKVVDGKDCLLRVNPEVAKLLKSVQNKYLEELEEILGRPVLVAADPLLHQEKFDLT